MINTYYAFTTFCTTISLESFYGHSRIQGQIDSLKRTKAKFDVYSIKDFTNRDQTTNNIVLIKSVIQSITESKGIDMLTIQKAISIDNALYSVVEPTVKEVTAEN